MTDRQTQPTPEAPAQPIGSEAGATRPDQALEIAARSVAGGAALHSVARWFDVPESELQAWIDANGDRLGSDVPEAAPDAVAEPTHSEEVERRDPKPDERVPVSPRPAPARFTPPVRSSSEAFTRNRRESHPSPMGVRDFLPTLRRRWIMIIAAFLLAVVTGWVTAPGKVGHVTTFQATHTLIYEPEGGQSYNIEQVALLATSGAVPSRVAARVQLDRGQVRSAVSAVAKMEVNTIAITGRGLQPALAESLADITAEELVAEIDGTSQAAYKAERDRLAAQLQSAEKRLTAVPPKDAAGQASARAEVDAAQRTLRQFEAMPAPKPEIRTLETATAAPVTAAGVQAPDSKPVRAFLLGCVGLLLAIAGAFGLERFDRRLRSKTRAEEAFGVPVIAEVPPLPKASHGKLLTVTESTSPFVEAYRGLRTYVALWAPESGHDDGHRVIVVTSPAPGEGKTTTVAHLAAMLAEIGRSVVVISADLRRPRLHQYFGRPEAPGLMDALTVPGGPTFDGLDVQTSVRGVRLVPSGPPTENPAPMIEHAGALLQAVRGMADFVLVDSPPLLVASDSVELARHADGVLLVARAGKTPVDAAEHCAELLQRLEIPVVGAVLVGSDAASSASRYYSARYYAEPDRSGRPRRRTGAASDEAGPMADTAAN